MLDEMYRVLEPGGRILTFSLHGIQKNSMIYHNPKFKSLWRNLFFSIRSSRWNEHENSRKSVAHTMIVSDKPRNFMRNYEIYGEIDLDLTELHQYLAQNHPELLENVSDEAVANDDEETLEEDVIDYLKLKYNNTKADKEKVVRFLKENNLVPYYQLPFKDILSLPGVLSREEHEKLKKHAEAVSLSFPISLSNIFHFFFFFFTFSHFLSIID